MLTVVTGAPCSGKTTYVAEQRAPEDIVIDLDALAHALGYPDTQVDWGAEHHAVTAARMARGHVIHSLLNGRLNADAWIIDADPRGGARAQYARAGARTVTLDPGPDVCLQRAAAADRPPATAQGIADWYARRGPALTAFR